VNLNETLAFVTVVREGSFTAAGRKMGTPKSTLSRQVARLEERMGSRLLHRTTRRIGLTEVGEQYFQRCLSAIEAIETAEQMAEQASARPAGTLRVSLPFGSWFLGSLLPEFHERYPDISLVLVAAQRQVDLVAEGFDVALRGGVLPDSGLIARKLADNRIIFVASPEYLQEYGTPGSLEELRDHRGVLYRAPTMQGRWRVEGPDGRVEVPLNPWLEANEFSFLRQALMAGGGIGLVLGDLVQHDLDTGRLVQVLPEYGLFGGGFYAVYPSSRHLSPKVRAFVDFVLERFPEVSRSMPA